MSIAIQSSSVGLLTTSLTFTSSDGGVTWVPWDGSVTATFSGAVDQGAAGTDPWPVLFLTPQAVTVSSLPLPTGAATEATLSALNAKVTAVNTGAVVVSSSALPTGAATESTLSTLNGKVTACNTGAVVVASGSITANAGTNLNTSALALESGGNIAAMAAVEGTTAGAAVITDANGTIQQYLRGLVKLAITAGSWLVTAQGDTAAAASDGGNPVKIGGKAASAAPSAVTAAQRVNGLFDLWGRLHARTGAQAPVASTFTIKHVPATATQATATQASAGSGKRNVCTGFTVTFTAGASAPTAAAPLTVAIIDGASGGGTYLWRSYINLPAVAGTIASINRTGLWLVGSQATALTVEFSAAGATNTYESVSLDGVIIEE